MNLQDMKIKLTFNLDEEVRKEIRAAKDLQSFYTLLVSNNITIDTESLRAIFTGLVQEHLDSTAQSRGYDNIISLCTYKDDSNPTFAAEGQAGIAWRSAVWTYCHQVLADVLSASRTAPSSDELIAELPVISW